MTGKKSSALIIWLGIILFPAACGLHIAAQWEHFRAAKEVRAYVSMLAEERK